MKHIKYWFIFRYPYGNEFIESDKFHESITTEHYLRIERKENGYHFRLSLARAKYAFMLEYHSWFRDYFMDYNKIELVKYDCEIIDVK